jgi:hypothetical protein
LISTPVFKISKEKGLAFKGNTRHLEFDSYKFNSSVILLEDGIPLPGPANSRHDAIRNFGEGRYSFWYSAIYFSTPDKSDPRTNGRQYTIQYTPQATDRFTPLFPRRVMQKILPVLHRIQPKYWAWDLYYWFCFLRVYFQKI